MRRLVIFCALLAACSPQSPSGTELDNKMDLSTDDALGRVQPGTINQAAIDDLLANQPWSYSSSKDDISSRNIISAATTSTNSVNFSPPYDGGSTLQIYVRNHPRSGVDVILSVSRGQIVCDVSDGCPIMAAFDGGKPQRFTGRVPSDYSSSALFVSPSGRFIDNLRRSSRAVIEVGFYQEGQQQFTFNTKNLHWPPQPADL